MVLPPFLSWLQLLMTSSTPYYPIKSKNDANADTHISDYKDTNWLSFKTNSNYSTLIWRTPQLTILKHDSDRTFCKTTIQIVLLFIVDPNHHFCGCIDTDRLFQKVKFNMLLVQLPQRKCNLIFYKQNFNICIEKWKLKSHSLFLRHRNTLHSKLQQKQFWTI